MPFDERLVRRLLVVAVGVLALGLYFFILRGADQPADPELLPSADALAGAEPPGDPARVPIGDFSELAIAVTPPGGEAPSLLWCLLAALDAAQRGQGLMGVTDLQGYDGMVFVYPEDTTSSFYMRNTPTPLSIAWIARDGAVVSTADMAPCEDREGCPTYAPAGPYRYAVEVFQGGLDELGIVEGARIELAGACAPRTSA